MLAVSNDDQPGVIGNLGTTLGNNKVNIARLHLSRDSKAKLALVVLNTDSAVAEDILDKLRKLLEGYKLREVRIGVPIVGN